MAGRPLRDLRRRSALLALAALGTGVTLPRAAAAAPAPDSADTVAPASEAAGPDANPDPEDPPPAGDDASSKPPRIDGPYLGGIVLTGLALTRLNGLSTGPFAGFGGSLRFGEMVLPWLGLGLSIGGAAGVGNGDARQQLGQGQLLVEGTFVPLAKKRVPLSLRAAFGFGGGAVTEQGRDGRSGYGGAAFAGAVGYTFFPWAKKKREFRGGGFGLGPELGWTWFSPAAPGRPMSNLITLGLTTTFYFGS